MEFCNSVRFKVKEGCEEEYLEINKSFENLPGQKMSRLFKTGDPYILFYWYLGIGRSHCLAKRKYDWKLR